MFLPVVEKDACEVLANKDVYGRVWSRKWTNNRWRGVTDIKRSWKATGRMTTADKVKANLRGTMFNAALFGIGALTRELHQQFVSNYEAIVYERRRRDWCDRFRRHPRGADASSCPLIRREASTRRVAVSSASSLLLSFKGAETSNRNEP